MKKPDKLHNKRAGSEPVLSHKDFVAKISKENQAYFEKIDAATESKSKNNTHISKKHTPMTASNMGLTREATIAEGKARRLLGGHSRSVFNLKPKIQLSVLLAILTAILVGAGLIAVVLCAIFLPSSGSGVGHEATIASSDADSDYLKDSAYSAAKTFATRAYPGAKSFSPRSQSPVRVTGGALYSVTLVVDGVNVFNAPIRQVVLVSETHTADEWHLLSIEQSE
jgi:hypothetical protein